jgi:hypothetical protein
MHWQKEGMVGVAVEKQEAAGVLPSQPVKIESLQVVTS